jgi:hypothetical protein
MVIVSFGHPLAESVVDLHQLQVGVLASSISLGKPN